jgi:protein arginine N-methyltransferase 1
MYSLPSLGGMIADRTRYRAYRRGLATAVRSATSVLDLGAGPGFWAIMAARLGAKRVYAVEQDESLAWGELAARRLGLSGLVVFLHRPSAEVELPERVDCIVSDLRGCLPLFTSHLPSIIDARQRFLRPGGQLLGARDTIWASVVHTPRLYRKLTEPWSKAEWGGAYEPALPAILNQFYRERFDRGALLCAPACWATLDYGSIQTASVSATLEFEIQRSGVGHGIGLWFDAELAPGIGFSNGPGRRELVYGRGVLPWLQAIDLDKGDRVVVELSARFVNGDYVWAWTTEVSGKSRFDQNSLYMVGASLESLRKRASNAVPTLSADAVVDASILKALDGRTTIMAAATAVMAAYPGRFGSIAEAMSHVGDLAVRYRR